MAASVWSGHLTFGLISMPVRLFSGARSSGISFNMLHRTDKSRLKQQYICQLEGVVVDRADMVKGYEFRKDEYIIIEPEEIKKIEPQTAKTMEILEFVKATDVDPVYFESSYYMMPEEAGRRPYALLTKALEESEYVAIAKITMHNREYTVVHGDLGDGDVLALFERLGQQRVGTPPGFFRHHVVRRLEVDRIDVGRLHKFED